MLVEDYYFKVICIDDGSIGKNTSIFKFAKEVLKVSSKSSTGVDVTTKTIELVNGKKARLQIFDISSQEQYHYFRPGYYRGSKGAILFFDLTNRESFDHIPKLIEEVRTKTNEIPMLLVGNKSDLTDQRQISRAEAEELSKEFKIYYMESSDKDGNGIGDFFSILSCIIIGIEVPDIFLKGIVLTDKNGKRMGAKTL